MIVTIDGPAGAGKSTAAKLLAMYLGYEYLDTGGIYRSVALLGLRHDVDWNDGPALVQLARSACIDSLNGRIFLNDEDVTDQVRTTEVTEHTKYAADNDEIRHLLVPLQRSIAQRALAENRGIITDGRDQGSVVFPDAHKKIFLTASPQVRAKRRVYEMHSRDQTVDFQTTLAQINARDERDRTRKVGPLVQPPDAFVLNTDGLETNAVVQRLLQYVQE